MLLLSTPFAAVECVTSFMSIAPHLVCAGAHYRAGCTEGTQAALLEADLAPLLAVTALRFPSLSGAYITATHKIHVKTTPLPTMPYSYAL